MGSQHMLVMHCMDEDKLLRGAKLHCQLSFCLIHRHAYQCLQGSSKFTRDELRDLFQLNKTTDCDTRDLLPSGAEWQVQFPFHAADESGPAVVTEFLRGSAWRSADEKLALAAESVRSHAHWALMWES